jgi:serine/threonine-protein kinase
VKSTPDWSALPADVPPHVVTLIQRCLEKDRNARIGDIAVARFLLEQKISLPSGREPAAAPQVRPPSRTGLVGAIGVAALALAAVALLLWRPWAQPRVAANPVRLTVDIGADSSLIDVLGASAVLSPDGTLLAFTALGSGGENLMLYTRRLDQLQATPLAGTEGALNPFFSPDGKWIGFFSGAKLKKIAVAGAEWARWQLGR